MSRRRRLLSIFIGLNLIVATSLSISAATGNPVSGPANMNIQFVHYVQLGMPEQDVFVEPYHWLDDLPSDFVYPLRPHDVHEYIPALLEPRSILEPHVVRVEPNDAQTFSYRAKSVYAAEGVIPHDPGRAGPNPTGPFWKGEALGFTLGQWLAARGSGMYVMNGKDSELRLTFQKLVPRGQYAMRCIATPAKAEFEAVESECPHWNSSRTAVQADADGNASLRLKLPALPESSRATTSMLQLVYLSRYDDWGGYGWSEHVQLLCEVPALW